ncbi:MAG: SDR family NAD(P)-dependent oxidoreductase [Armatimonadetes bacterium]|nr:SDR family NAD(P)-dependent oxidoreductase [Armatimonadota bacterium]
MRLDPGTVAVVTGAGSGIGRAVSLALAARGCHLALVDRSEEGLEETRELLQAAGRRPVTLHVLDVADREAMAQLPEVVSEYHRTAHLLVNNAGVSLAGPLDAVSLEDMEWIVGVNFWGAVYACRAFLPSLRQAPAAHIVNVLSDFALLGFPTRTAYCATKFALRGFTEGLRAELHHVGIGVTAVYPGPAATNIVRAGRNWDPARALLEDEFLQARGLPLSTIAERTVRGVERNAARVLIGRETYLIDGMTRLCPVLTGRLLARFQDWIGFLGDSLRIPPGSAEEPERDTAEGPPGSKEGRG